MDITRKAKKLSRYVILSKNSSLNSVIYMKGVLIFFQQPFSCIYIGLEDIFVANLAEIDGVVFSPAAYKSIRRVEAKDRHLVHFLNSCDPKTDITTVIPNYIFFRSLLYFFYTMYEQVTA